MYNPYSQHSPWLSEPEVQESPTLTVYGLFRQGMTVREVTLLIAARKRYLGGELTEWPGEYHRLCFARWLYEQGLIDG